MVQTLLVQSIPYSQAQRSCLHLLVYTLFICSIGNQNILKNRQQMQTMLFLILTFFVNSNRSMFYHEFNVLRFEVQRICYQIDCRAKLLLYLEQKYFCVSLYRTTVFVFSVVYMQELLSHQKGIQNWECYLQNRYCVGMFHILSDVKTGVVCNRANAQTSLQHVLRDDSRPAIQCSAFSSNNIQPIIGPPPTKLEVRLYLLEKLPESLLNVKQGNVLT